MKAFDKIGDNLKPDEEFNKQSEQIDKKIIDQKQSIEKEQEQNLRDLFYNNNVFLNRRNDNLLYTYNESGDRVSADNMIGERIPSGIPETSNNR